MLFFKKKISSSIVALMMAMAGCVGYFAHDVASVDHSITGVKSECAPVMAQIRQRNYEFTRPLLLTDVVEEDSRLTLLKGRISDYLDSRKQEGVLLSASVYLRIANTGARIAVNDGERYAAGSLMKVPMLLYFLKQAEKDPSVLRQQVYFAGHFNAPRLQSIVTDPLQPGMSYSVEELLRRMVVNSDNDATILLNNIAGSRVDEDLYDDLHLARPDRTSGDYLVTVEECSRFFRVLFNATYLSPSFSDYALRLLAGSAFHNGLTRQLNPAVRVPRKFAERASGGVSQFHEIGIVYLGREPYLLGVMTRGGDLKILQDVVSDVSQIVYAELKKGDLPL